MKKVEINYPPEDIECFKVVKNQAFFQWDGITRVYTFETLNLAETWKNRRSVRNRKEKTFEDFMACNDEGIYDYQKYYKLHMSMGILPPDPCSLAELYAFREVTGKDYIDEDGDDVDLYQVFTANKLARKPFQRNKDTKVISTDRKGRLKQLTDRSNLPEYMGELLLEEIKLSTDAPNEFLRSRAKLLGLM